MLDVIIMIWECKLQFPCLDSVHWDVLVHYVNLWYYQIANLNDNLFSYNMYAWITYVW